MRKLISLGWRNMVDLVQKLRRNWTIENKIAIEQLHFLDSLESLQSRYWGGGWCRRDMFITSVVIFKLFPAMRIGPIWIVRL